ncbi:MAG: bifunctional riboflavin kinase/FAD synthetase [Proteiniphilum sp.]|nr:bifunctional riboflavin kinase/FAD synthetase [Proteiniphilum sp.]
MEVIDLSQEIIGEKPTKVVATLGFFDGVHMGHRHLIDQVKKEAERQGLPSAVITFPVHPRKVLQSDYQPKLICGYTEKIAQLVTTGIDYVFSIPFTREISMLSANDFICNVLSDQVNVSTLVIGYDHRFGRNREEDFEDYVKYGNAKGINILQATELRFDDDNVSSSEIRRLLMNGNIVKANNLLTYHYTLSGKIVEGYQVGRTIGFPTANMKIWEKYKVVPQLGVYAVYVHFNNNVKEGMLYIGKRPTLHNDPQISVEVNIFDFDGDLYNQSLTVEFVDFIRGDEKFTTVEKLIESIHRDKVQVKARLKKEKRYETH